MEYDSKNDTQKHIDTVTRYLHQVASCLSERAAAHDASKLVPPEKEAFDRCTPKLKETVYGTEEYKAACRELGPALKHHHEHNRHHPEFHENGVSGMTLIDLIEMFMDWKAAGERHDDGCILRSIEINATRFGINSQLKSILENTAVAMGWLPEEEK